MSSPGLKSSMTPKPSQKRPYSACRAPDIGKCLQPSALSPPSPQLLASSPLHLSPLACVLLFCLLSPISSPFSTPSTSTLPGLASARLGLYPNHLLSLSEDVSQEAFLDLLKQGYVHLCTLMQPSTILHCACLPHSYTKLFTDTKTMILPYLSLCPKYLTLPGT